MLNNYLKKIYIYNGGNFEPKPLETLKKTDIFKLTSDDTLYTTEDNPTGIWVAISDVKQCELTIEARPYMLAEDYKISRWI